MPETSKSEYLRRIIVKIQKDGSIPGNDPWSPSYTSYHNFVRSGRPDKPTKFPEKDGVETGESISDLDSGRNNNN